MNWRWKTRNSTSSGPTTITVPAVTSKEVRRRLFKRGSSLSGHKIGQGKNQKDGDQDHADRARPAEIQVVEQRLPQVKQ